MLNKGEIYQAITELYDEMEAESGNKNVDLTALKRKAKPLVKETSIDKDEIAINALVKEWDKRRRPTRDGQSTFFDGDKLVPTARYTRVKMKYATAEDMLGWRTLTRGSRDRSLVACNAIDDYIEMTLTYFSPEMTTLGAIYEVYPNLEQDGSIYASPEWIALRDSVVKDANYACADCQGTAETAHHTTYLHGIICDKKYLVPLCWPCHRKRHPDKAE